MQLRTLTALKKFRQCVVCKYCKIAITDSDSSIIAEGINIKIVKSFILLLFIIFIVNLFGRPIVTTDSGGPSDFIHSGNGITSLASIDNLANAMIKMMEEYNTFDQHKLSEECRSRFAEKKIEAEIEALYLKAIDKHK